MVVALLGLLLGTAGILVIADRFDAPAPNAWPETSLEADRVDVYRNTAKRPLHLHTWLPDGEGLSAAIVFFHGGGLERTPLDQFVTHAQRLSDAGMVAIVAEYRVAWDGVGRAGSQEDARAAVEWVRDNAVELRVDPARVAVAGASAGGTLAVATTTGTSQQRPDLLVLFNPAVGPSSTSPGQPTKVFHGDSDRSVSPDGIGKWCEAAVDCAVDFWPGGDHGFFNLVNPEAYEYTYAEAESFLKSRGYLD